MSYSYTRSTTGTETFSLSSARYVASKVATDLRQLQRYYGSPPDADIDAYAEEAAVLAHRGCVEKVSYGFKRDGRWVLALEYNAVNGTLTTDDRAGGVYRYADVSGATFHSFLARTQKWWSLSHTEREEIDSMLPVTRIPGTAPGYSGGYHTTDRTYSARGTGLSRSTYRPL